MYHVLETLLFPLPLPPFPPPPCPSFIPFSLLSFVPPFLPLSLPLFQNRYLKMTRFVAQAEKVRGTTFLLLFSPSLPFSPFLFPFLSLSLSSFVLFSLPPFVPPFLLLFLSKTKQKKLYKLMLYYKYFIKILYI